MSSTERSSMDEADPSSIASLPPDTPSAARCQAVLSLLVLGVLALAIGIALFFTGHDSLLLPRRVAQVEKHNTGYIDGRFFRRQEDRLLYATIPSADYSSGGVYFIGDSTLEWAAALWKLPAAEQKLIWDYCLAQQTYTQQFQFVRYLIEQRNLLKGGPGKTLFIADLNFPDSSHVQTVRDSDNLWRSFFVSTGMYTYDLERGLGSVPMSPLQQWGHLALARNAAFWTWAQNILFLKQNDYEVVGGGHGRVADYPEFWKTYMGSDWERGMDLELDQLGKMIDYLHARNVKISTVFMPMGSWCNSFPPYQRYRERVLALLGTKSVPVTDLSDDLPDDRFIDSMHLTYQGVMEIQPELIGMARAHIERLTGR